MDIVKKRGRPDRAIRDAAHAEDGFWSLSTQLRIENWADAKSRLESFVFADGTVIDVAGMLSGYAGEKGDEVITGMLAPTG